MVTSNEANNSSSLGFGSTTSGIDGDNITFKLPDITYSGETVTDATGNTKSIILTTFTMMLLLLH